jgi:hypothetical protein
MKVADARKVNGKAHEKMPEDLTKVMGNGGWP